MEQKDTNFIKLENSSGAANPSDNIFNELGEDLDFGVIQQDAQKGTAFDAIAFWYKASYFAMVFSIVVAIVMSLDVFLKSSEDNTVLSLIPGCEFISTYGMDMVNPDCKTSSMLLAENQKSLTALEDSIGKNIEVVLPKMLKIADVLTMPEVRFIQENTNNTRIDIVDMIAHFQKIKNDSSITYGSFIDCKVDSANEKGELNLSCSAYGGRLLSASKTDPTSRNVAISLINKLAEPTSQFIITEMPKTFEISQFMSADSGKSLFSTQTTFTLKLKFTPNAQF